MLTMRLFKISAFLILAATFIFPLSACQGDRYTGTIPAENNTPTSELDPRVINTSFLSSITGVDYPVHIYLPENYDSSTENYPVIYATDGQWIFSGFSSAIKSRRLDIILVAIEQGPDNRRATDYLLPGAQTYFEFLRTEFLPYIESEYRVDQDQRTIQGASYGGLFVGLALLMDDVVDPLFKNYLCFDGSFFEHPNATSQLEYARYNASLVMNANLVLTSALGVNNNDRVVTQFQSNLLNRNYTGLTIYKSSYNVHHNDVAQPSFEYSLDALF